MFSTFVAPTFIEPNSFAGNTATFVTSVSVMARGLAKKSSAGGKSSHFSCVALN